MIDFAPHDLTTNTSHSPFVVTASQTYLNSNSQWAAFDGTVSGGGYMLWETPTRWIALDTGGSYTLLQYQYQVNTIPEPARAMKDWTMQGSNDNSSWTVIDTVTGETGWGSGETRTYVCDDTSTAYRYFKIVCTANNGDATYTQIGELYLYADVPPTANFTGTPTSGYIPLTVNFTDSSTGSYSTWAWDFGDGGTSSSQNPSHVYSAVGTYSVSLTVDGSSGSSELTRSNYITASLTPPTPHFSFTPNSGFAPLDVYFTDSSTGTISTWTWNFGDGETSHQQNPAHRYRYPGTYTPSLTVANSGGSNSFTSNTPVAVTDSTTPTPPVWRPEPTHHISGTIHGNQIAGYVLSLRRVGHICSPGQHATLTMSPDWPHGSRPGLQCFLYENDIQVMKGFIVKSTRSRPSHDWIIEIDDTYTLVNSTFMDTQEATTPGHDTRYWASYILEHCGTNFSINGVAAPVPEGIQIGLRPASEALKDIITYASWYAWPDKDGTIQVGRFDRSISSRTIAQFDDFEYDISDDMTRNDIRVYGNGRIFAEATQAVHGIYPNRIAVVGSPLIKTYAEAQRVADYMIAEIGDLTKVIRGTIPGNPKIRIGNVVTLTYLYEGVRYSVTDTVSSLESNYDAQEGYTMAVTVGERCPRIAGFSEKIPWTYAGLDGNGVYYSRDKGVTWAQLGTGLPTVASASRVAGDSYGKAVAIVNGRVYYETGNVWKEQVIFGSTAKAVGSLGGIDSFAVLTGSRVYFSVPSSGSEPPDDPTMSTGEISEWTPTTLSTTDEFTGDTLYASGIDMYTKTGTAYINGIPVATLFGLHTVESHITYSGGEIDGTTDASATGLGDITLDDFLPHTVVSGTYYNGYTEVAISFDTQSNTYADGHCCARLTLRGTLSVSDDSNAGASIRMSYPNATTDYYGAGTGSASPSNQAVGGSLTGCTPGNSVDFQIRATNFINHSWWKQGYGGLTLESDTGAVSIDADAICHATAAITEIIVDYDDGGWGIFYPSSGSASSGSYNLYTANASESLLISDIPFSSSINDRLYVSDDGDVIIYNTAGRLLISNDFGSTWHSAFPSSAPTNVPAVTRAQVPSTIEITSGSYNTVIGEVTGSNTVVEWQGAPESSGGWSAATGTVPATFKATDAIWSELSTQGILIGGGGYATKIYRYDPQVAPFTSIVASDTGIPSSGSSNVLDLEFGE
jgi:PKD repeat protein